MISIVKNIHFKIVDDELISKTGGIVQGMSGSPIIQNNMIIGAVTHVFLLFGTYICDGLWVALPSSWCPGVCARASEMGWGVAPTCLRAYSSVFRGLK